MRLTLFAFAAALTIFAARAHAQNQGTPGQFDFYLLDVAWAADFCNVPGIVAPCSAPKTFVLHGLWPQNNDGTYPVNCGKPTPLKSPAGMLDVTPNLGLIQHEWDKHGTCTSLSEKQYFAATRRAYRRLKVPKELAHPTQDLTSSQGHILDLFYIANPNVVADSFVLGCSKGKFTQIALCLDKSMKPIACSNVHLCKDPQLEITVAAPTQ